VTFPCPGCGGAIDRDPGSLALRCPACGAVLRSRAADTSGAQPAFDVEVVGRPDTRRRVEVPWDDDQRRRLASWLAWSSVLTLALVLVLYVVARWYRS
jgi:predicted RNA-binding Zn-ribbon protein involved in translation (DUF1610 family)